MPQLEVSGYTIAWFGMQIFFWIAFIIYYLAVCYVIPYLLIGRYHNSVEVYLAVLLVLVVMTSENYVAVSKEQLEEDAKKLENTDEKKPESETKPE